MVHIEKLTSMPDLSELLELKRFLGTLTCYEENDFKWPKQLMDARDSREILEQLALMETDEQSAAQRLAQNRVPQETFWIYNRDQDKLDTIVGLIKIHTLLTPELLHHGGHIGYGIAPQYRGQRFASEALPLALDYCRDHHGMHDVLLTIRRDNGASRRMALRLGAKEWDVVQDPKFPDTVRYWLSL